MHDDCDSMGIRESPTTEFMNWRKSMAIGTARKMLNDWDSAGGSEFLGGENMTRILNELHRPSTYKYRRSHWMLRCAQSHYFAH
eukprot:scaffold12_cov88-Cylindrotheca_fusiformis.AAC.1